MTKKEKEAVSNFFNLMKDLRKAHLDKTFDNQPIIDGEIIETDRLTKAQDIPVKEGLCYVVKDRQAYTLKFRVWYKSLCELKVLTWPDLLKSHIYAFQNISDEVIHFTSQIFYQTGFDRRDANKDDNIDVQLFLGVDLDGKDIFEGDILSGPLGEPVGFIEDEFGNRTYKYDTRVLGNIFLNRIENRPEF